MPSYEPPKKNAEYVFYVSLTSQADAKVHQVDPTLAAGDVKVSTDGGTEADLTTLPVVTPASSKRIKVTLSAAEMNGDNVQVTFSDAADAEWNDLMLNIQTSAELLENQFKTTRAVVEHQRGSHTHQPGGSVYYVDPVNGDTHANGNRGGINDPYAGVQDCHDNAVTDSNHDLVILLAGSGAGATTLTEDVTISKRYTFFRGPGRDFIWTRSGNGDTITITGDGIELSGFQINTAATGSGNGITVTSADFFKASRLWVNDTQGHGMELTDCDNYQIDWCKLQGSGQGGSGHGITIIAGSGESSNYGRITECSINDVAGDGIRLDTTGGGTNDALVIRDNVIQGCTSDGIAILDSGTTDVLIANNTFGNNTSSDINDSGTNTVATNNEQWATGSLTLASINAEVDAALSDIGLDHIVASAVIGTDITDDSIVAKLVSSSATADWDDFVNTTDSLQAIKDLGDVNWISGSGVTESSIWTHATRTLTQSAQSIQDAIAGLVITRTLATDWSIAITGLGDISGRLTEKVWFTIKTSSRRTDAQALVQITETDGLVVVNGATPVSAGSGSLTVDNETNGDITIVLDADQSAAFPAGEFIYDLKWRNPSGKILLLSGVGEFVIIKPATLDT